MVPSLEKVTYIYQTNATIIATAFHTFQTATAVKRNIQAVKKPLRNLVEQQREEISRLFNMKYF